VEKSNGTIREIQMIRKWSSPSFHLCKNGRWQYTYRTEWCSKGVYA